MNGPIKPLQSEQGTGCKSTDTSMLTSRFYGKSVWMLLAKKHMKTVCSSIESGHG